MEEQNISNSLSLRVAIPTRNSMVDDHFGHCEHFTVVDIVDSKVDSMQKLESPEGCGCRSGIAATLSSMGVTLMLAGNIGQGAVTKLKESNIKVIRGCKGEICQVVDALLKGELHDNAQVCSSHECHSDPSLLDLRPL